VAANITPDNDTGIGKWSDEQIVNAIRSGKRPEGTLIGPAMPIVFYRNMWDSDVLATVAYLRPVKAVNHAAEKSVYKSPLPESYGPTVDHVASVPMGDQVAYGANLASIGHCMACHTPMVNDKLDMTRAGAGGGTRATSTWGWDDNQCEPHFRQSRRCVQVDRHGGEKHNHHRCPP
jgi:hypothetical protein